MILAQEVLKVLRINFLLVAVQRVYRKEAEDLQLLELL